MSAATETLDQILNLIVKKVLEEREAGSLLQAYIDELEEDWEENHGGLPVWESLAGRERWQTQTFGMLHCPNVEKVMADTFVSVYRKLVQHPVTREEALEAFEFPHFGFPDHNVPESVAVAVATALAERDAVETNVMREWAKSRQQP